MTPALLVACFVVDITPPVGHPLCAGLVPPVQRIEAPLLARGFVLKSGGKPIVVCVADWCEIHSDSYDQWRKALAEAAGTTPERVFLCTIHQHDAPLADAEARRVLDDLGIGNTFTDPKFDQEVYRRVAAAVCEAVKSPRRVTHVGFGQGIVEKVASNRRIVGPDGKVGAMRASSCTDAALRAAPEGTIDPYLKTISFWDGDKPVLAMSCYATHPMSYYRTGIPTGDFFALARARREQDDPNVFQIMFNGCGGNIGAGKYNDGSKPMRGILTDRVYQGMIEAWKTTHRHPISKIGWRVDSLVLPPKTAAAFTDEAIQKKLKDPKASLGDRVGAAFVLSGMQRMRAGKAIEVPTLDLGEAQITLLPGEPFIEYQLLAQKLRPDKFVMIVGYGDSGMGYVPVDRAFAEGGYEPGDWCLMGPGTEAAVVAVLRKALKVGS